MRALKRADLFFYLFALVIVQSVTGCKKENKENELVKSSSKALNSTAGIGGYDLLDTADRAFAFDYDHSGKLDHMVVYRPGKKAFWIIENNGGTFSPVYQGSNGIGGFNFDQKEDQALAFDYEHSGKLDYLVVYRPGSKAIRILHNNNGTFTPIFQSSNGIGGFNLDHQQDRIFAYDYDHSGKLDYLVVYRPGSKAIWILHNNNGTFTPVYQGSNGIGGYNLDQPQDKVFAFDHDHTGKLDHLVLYRPGSKAYWIVQHNGNNFVPVFQGSNGIGGFNLDHEQDLSFAYDYEGSGKMDYLVLYRPASKAYWIIKNEVGGGFVPVFQSSNGIGGFNLDSKHDLSFPFDFGSTGISRHIVVYRPGSGAFWILENNGTSFNQVF